MTAASGEQEWAARALEDAYQGARAIIDRADAERVIYTDSGWRVKDLVAHVAAWEEENLRSLEAHAHGGEYRVPGYVDDDTYNAAAYLRHRDEPTDAIYGRWEALRRRMVELARALSPERYAADMLYPWGQRGPVAGLLGSTVGHQNEHAAHIDEAIAPSAERARLLADLDATHAAATRELRAYDPEAVVYAESGWRVKDIVAHLVHWEESMFRGLEAYHQGSRYHYGYDSFDAFNAAGAAARWDVPFETSLEDWARIRARFKDLTRALTSAQLAGEMDFSWGGHGAVARLYRVVLHHPEEHLEDVRANVRPG